MPTFDPRDLPPNVNPNSYGLEPIRVQNLLQQSFERWLSQPSPTTERLVDQALISAGRQPMFGRLGANIPPSVGARTPTQRLSDLAKMSVGRAPWVGGYRGQPYASQQFRAVPYGQQPDSSFYGFAARGGYGQGGASISGGGSSFFDAMRLWKNMNTVMTSMLGEERRVRFLLEGQSGGSRAAVGAQNLWRVPPSFATPTGLAASPAVGAALAQHMNAVMGGGGGRGVPPGGHGGGGGFGGGGFAGGLLGGALGRRGLHGLWQIAAGEAAWEALHWPLAVGHFARSEFQKSAPFTDWRERIANMTRLPASLEQSGQVRRTMLEENLLPFANRRVPSWMTSMGLTQTGVTDILGRMGGGVQAGTDPIALVQSLRRLRLGAGFAMAPEGSTEALAMMGQRFGITRAGEQAGFPGQFSQFMARGQAAGADSRDLLAAIKDATEELVKSGVKLDLSATSGWAVFMQHMQQVGVPPAQAAVMAGQAVGGFAAAGQRPFANALTGTVFSQLISKTNFNDPDAVYRLFGRTSQQIMDSGTPFEKQTLRLLQQDNAKMSPLALRFGSQMIGASPKARGQAVDIIRGMGGQGPMGDTLTTAMLSAMFGVDLPTAAAILEGETTRRRGGDRHRAHIPGVAAPMAGTTPTDVWRSEVETTTTVLRGMRAQFEAIGSNLDKINRVLESFSGKSLGSILWGMSPFGGSAPPAGGGGGLGGAWRGIKHFFGFGGGATTPSGGTAIPGDFGARGEYGVGLGPARRGFMSRAGALMRDLMGTFGLSSAQAAGFTGNPAYESAGLTPGIQERGVRSGRGGLGYAQWTGPRRRMFEQWAAARGLSTSSEEANRGFLMWELANTGVGHRTIAALKGTRTLEEATFSVGRIFENPRGTTDTFLPGYSSRLAYANRALHSIDYPRTNVSASAVTQTGDMGARGEYGVGQSGGQHFWHDVHEAVSSLGHVARETSEHLHELGHGARRAHRGLSSGHGPNSSTSPASTSSTAAYGG